MSAVTRVCVADKNKDIVGSLGVSDAKLGALNVWNFMAKKYFGVPFANLIRDELEDMVWSLITYKYLPIAERIVLASTLDGAYVAKKDFPDLVAAVQTVSTRGLVGNLQEQVVSMAKLNNDLIEFFAWEQNPSYQAHWASGSIDDESSFNIFGLKIIKDELDALANAK